jgi:hypothetical protein
MPEKEEIIRRRIKQLEKLIGHKLPEFERELIPHPGEELKPLAAKKRRVARE